MSPDQTHHVDSERRPQLGGRSRRRRRGAAVVEFAVVAPIMFMLTFGSIELGRLIMVGQLVETAAAAGAREASKSGTTASSEVQGFISSYLQSASVPANALTVTVSPSDLGDQDAGTEITVTVQVDFDQVTWLPPLFVSSGTQVQASAVMSRE